MIVVWGKTVMAEVDQIVDAVRNELLHTGLMRRIHDTGNNIMVTCTEHKGGQESKPSMGISKVERYDTIQRREIPAGTVHCFTCGYTADLPTWIAHVLGMESPVKGMDWLMRRYAYGIDGERADLRLNLERTSKVEAEFVPDQVVNDLWFAFNQSADAIDYMVNTRGIPREICNKAKVGYDREEHAVAFPVTDIKGRTLFIKLRGIEGRRFHNDENSRKSMTFFGITVLIRELNRLKAGGQDISRVKVWVCEGEIDCLTLWRRGILAVSLMGSDMSEQQAKILKRFGVGQVVAALDNPAIDVAGRKGVRKMKDLLIPMGIKVFNVRYNSNKKDWNEMTDEEFAMVELF